MRLISAALIVTSALTLFAPARGEVVLCKPVDPVYCTGIDCSTTPPVYCTGIDCSTTPPDPCDGDQDRNLITRMNLTDSVVVENSLHLTDGELRYKDVGKNKNEDLDLRITVNTEVEEYEYTNIEQAWEDRNERLPDDSRSIPEGYNGKKLGSAFGILNLQTLKGKPFSGEGNFEVCLVKSGTNELIKNNFTFTVFDFDERGEDDKSNPKAMIISIKEKVLIDLGSKSTYKLSNDTEINVACEDSPYTLDDNGRCPDGVRTVFLSSSPGGAGDNPETVYGLTPQQRNRAVSLQFVDTDCFDITFDHYCPCEQDESVLLYDIPANRDLKCKTDWKNRPKCRYYSGGNFLFAGDAPEVTEIYPCITNSPTVQPTTLEPTTLEPTTREPTLEPTLPPTKPRSTCDKGAQVFLEHEIGDYGGSIALKDAIQVISQETSTVTVALKNVWPSSDGKITSIFYQYKDTVANEACGKAGNLTLGDPIREITISCLHIGKYAKFDLYVVDESMAFTNKTKIPECCEGGNTTTYPAVKYTFSVNCDCYKYPDSGPTSSPTVPTTSPFSSPTDTPTNDPTTTEIPLSTSPFSSSTGPFSLPTDTPTNDPTTFPTEIPPSTGPFSLPTDTPTASPTYTPTSSTSSSPTSRPSFSPTVKRPSFTPTVDPTTSNPTANPTASPTLPPTASPSTGPSTMTPTPGPSTTYPDVGGTESPTSSPTTPLPTGFPSLVSSTADPTTATPTNGPSDLPESPAPSTGGTTAPTFSPTTPLPTGAPSTPIPSPGPSPVPETPAPTTGGTTAPTFSPTTPLPTGAPSTPIPSPGPSTIAPTPGSEPTSGGDNSLGPSGSPEGEVGVVGITAVKDC